MNLDQQRVNRRTFIQSLGIGGTALLLERTVRATTLVADSPIANTKAGRVRGYTDNGINVFKGIRYGADTTGRRFMPPLPPEPWSEMREAVSYGRLHHNRASAPARLFVSQRLTPVCVMVANDLSCSSMVAPTKRFRSSPLYDGVRLCRRGDVVVVSQSSFECFWLSLSGQFGGAEFADSGNVGQLTCLVALGA